MLPVRTAGRIHFRAAGATRPLLVIAFAARATRGTRAAHCGHFAILPSLNPNTHKARMYRCRTTPRRHLVMSDGTNSRSLPSITARLTVEEKQRFASIAAARGISESKLTLVAIRALLESTSDVVASKLSLSARDTARDRITIRLRPGDRRAIRDRAAERGLRDSAYIAALVRSHVSANPPLTGPELEALKASVVVLAGLGRLLARMSREAASSQTALTEELRRTREFVADVERYTCNLIRAALESWESHHE
jgi:hypothetical protein